MKKTYNQPKEEKIEIGDLVRVGFISVNNGVMEPAFSLGVVVKIRKLLKTADIFVQASGKTWKRVPFGQFELVSK